MAHAQVSIRVPDELHRQAKACAALRGETVSNVIRSALEEYVRRGLRDFGPQMLASVGELASKQVEPGEHGFPQADVVHS